MKKDPNKPAKLGVWGTAKYIFNEAGLKGLYRGVTPRVALGVWQTICMVALGDVAKVLPLFVYQLTTGIYCKFDGRKTYGTLRSTLLDLLAVAFRVHKRGKNLEENLRVLCFV